MSDPFKDALRKAGETSDTPETDAFRNQGFEHRNDELEKIYDHSENLERQLAEAREQLASEKATRNAIIAKGIETERQLAEARQAFAVATDQLVQAQGELRQVRGENARLREAVKEARDCILSLLNNGHSDGCEWINYANSACNCGVDDGRFVLSKLQPFLTP